MSTEFLQKRTTLLVLAAVLFGAILLAYSNHFNNAFHFDDTHTIEQNNAIKQFDAVRYFKDGTTFSVLPANQSYRPLTTLENALDYALAGALNPRYFHVHIFTCFLLCCLFIFIFSKQLFTRSNDGNPSILALIVTAIFGLLCANAETVNYIIQRAEITSAVFILLGLIFYIKDGFFKTYHLYLIFPFIGFFSKEMAFVFAPLLFLYILLFEEEVSLLEIYKKTTFTKALKAFTKTLPAILFTAAFLVFYAKMLPETFSSGGLNRYEYLITQPWVVCHYIATFFYPYNLSADTDWITFTTITDYRAILGILIVLGVIWLSLKASKKRETRLFSFGMLWFLVSLLPTSSIVPFSEVLNDHRTFIPYIGLTIAIVGGLHFFMQKFAPKVSSSSSGKVIIGVLLIAFLGANAYGIHKRNKVWKTEESLWQDVTIKSPKNGRGMMNYGLALMARGDYINAEIYFNKSAKLIPTYPYLYINLGILKNAIGQKEQAEVAFKHAINLDPNQHNSWYYYAEFLIQERRYAEALDCLRKVEQISPGFINTPTYFMQAYNGLGLDAINNLQFDKAIPLFEKALKINPHDQYTLANLAKSKTLQSQYASMRTNEEKADFYLDLSLEYYHQSLFERCIEAAKKSNEFLTSANAYNNICSAYNQLNNSIEAIKACQEALKLDPNHELAKGNLGHALEQLKN